MSAGLAVISGIILSLIFTNPYEGLTKKIASKLLAWSVVGLGFGMNLSTVIKAGIRGLSYTMISIVVCVIAGLILGKVLRNRRDTSILITFGTAICGGSAIAAIAPTIRAKHHEISVALATIFVLNAVSLFIFPIIGHYFQLSQEQFGLWSALAIQDTSSVVGASLQYGAKALEVGTTVKLARALWIVPCVMAIGMVYAHFFLAKQSGSKKLQFKKPWFILGFILAAALVTWVPACKIPGLYIRDLAEQVLIIVLFCIGASLSRDAIKEVGIKPFLQGSILWLLMAIVTFIVIKSGYISF